MQQPPTSRDFFHSVFTGGPTSGEPQPWSATCTGGTPLHNIWRPPGRPFSASPLPGLSPPFPGPPGTQRGAEEQYLGPVGNPSPPLLSPSPPLSTLPAPSLTAPLFLDPAPSPQPSESGSHDLGKAQLPSPSLSAGEGGVRGGE